LTQKIDGKIAKYISLLFTGTLFLHYTARSSQNGISFFGSACFSSSKQKLLSIFILTLTYIGMVALELIIAAPFALLMIGYDSLSIQIGYLALVLATLSQVR
jgi:hypothetical protein